MKNKASTPEKKNEKEKKPTSNALCVRCQGLGEYRGLGFVITDCELCKKDVKSSKYNSAIEEIMRLDAKMTREDAERLFEEEMRKQQGE